MSYSSGPKPYVVKYKADREKSIKAGIRGRFETEEEAKLEVVKTREFYDLGYGVPNAAKVGIVIDHAALELQMRRDNGTDDGLGDIDDETVLESGPLEAIPFLAELIEAEHGMVLTEAEKLVRKHAKIVTRLTAKGPLGLKAGKAIIKAILYAESNPAKDSDRDAELELLREENERLAKLIVEKKLEAADGRHRKLQEVEEDTL